MLLKKKFGKAGSDVCTFCSLSREQLQVEDLLCLCPFSQTLWKNLESLWFLHCTPSLKEMIVSFFGKGHNILNNFISIGWKICTMSVQEKPYEIYFQAT